MIDSRSSGTSKWALVGLFSVIALALAAGGFWFYRHEAEAIQNHANDDLKAIAELKVNQIVRWRNERIADARQNSAAPFLRAAVIQWIQTPNDMVLKTRIKTRLQMLKDSEGYENVILADRKGKVLVTLNPRLIELEAETKQLTSKVISFRQLVFGDFFRCSGCKQVHLDVAAPILNQVKQPVAVLILRTNPVDYLYPLIQSWPTPSKSAETLLIRKDGDNTLFLNVLRHRADPALPLRIPLSRTDIPAVQASRGRTELFEGLDYRGVKVLADIRPVPGSPWFMVAKVGRDEIMSEAAERTRLIGLLTLALIVLFGVGTPFSISSRVKGPFKPFTRPNGKRPSLRRKPG